MKTLYCYMLAFIVLISLTGCSYFKGVTYEEGEIFKGSDHNGDTYYYLYFGKYPQTVELNKKITSELDKLTTPNEDGYYTYKDIEYVKNTTNLYSTDCSWINGTTAMNDTDYYFKVEPIKWRIIQNSDTIEVVSEYILDHSVFYSSTNNRNIYGQTIYPNNYEYSDLREFLNNDFLNCAFSSSQQELIKNSEVNNSATTTPEVTNTFACNNTYDKIYSLSYIDVIDFTYGFINHASRSALVTDFAMSMNVENNNGVGNWLIRSPYSRYAYCNYSVYYDSRIGYSTTIISGHGIRPAFTFNQEI